MPVVYIYPANGRFAGSDFEWNCPPLATQHDFMLFMRQDADLPAPAAALAAIDRFGFKQVKMIAEGRAISVESLNDPKLSAFRQNYEDALDKGFSLAWYP
jgi:hypothetical protein